MKSFLYKSLLIGLYLILSTVSNHYDNFNLNLFLFCIVSITLNGLIGTSIISLLAMFSILAYKIPIFKIEKGAYDINIVMVFCSFIMLLDIYYIVEIIRMSSVISIEDREKQLLEWIRCVVQEPLYGIVSSVESIKRKANISEDGEDVINSLESCIKNIIMQLENNNRFYLPDVKLEPIKIECLCKEIMLIVSQQASKKNQSLTYSITKDCPQYIVSDPVKLQQILINLLFNSIKYTHQGGEIRMVLEVERKEKKENLKISIIDNGMGIVNEEVKYIFKKYRRSNRIAKENLGCLGGVGLGLPISKHLAELIDADISAYSEGDNKGSTFVLTLPLNKFN